MHVVRSGYFAWLSVLANPGTFTTETVWFLRVEPERGKQTRKGEAKP
jgi:hypothetical protein